MYDEKAAEKYIWLHQLTLMPKARMVMVAMTDRLFGMDVELSEYLQHFLVAYHADILIYLILFEHVLDVL